MILPRSDWSEMDRFETRFERLELKFVISEAQALRIRRDLEPYCCEDAPARIGRPEVRPRKSGVECVGIHVHLAIEACVARPLTGVVPQKR